MHAHARNAIHWQGEILPQQLPFGFRGTVSIPGLLHETAQSAIGPALPLPSLISSLFSLDPFVNRCTSLGRWGLRPRENGEM